MVYPYDGRRWAIPGVLADIPGIPSGGIGLVRGQSCLFNGLEPQMDARRPYRPMDRLSPEVQVVPLRPSAWVLSYPQDHFANTSNMVLSLSKPP